MEIEDYYPPYWKDSFIIKELHRLGFTQLPVHKHRLCVYFGIPGVFSIFLPGANIPGKDHEIRASIREWRGSSVGGVTLEEVYTSQLLDKLRELGYYSPMQRTI